jgi:hypothetical protein
MIIKDLSFAEYRAIDAVNVSRLSGLSKCPAYFKFTLTNERPDSPALAIGRLIHTLVFQQELFQSEYFILPELDRRTAKGRETYNELVSANPDKAAVKSEDFNRAAELAASVRSNPHFSRLIDGAMFEVTLTWTDEETGIKCKARLDCYNPELGVIVDLKTTIDASPRGFPRKLYAYRYNCQAAWYLHGLVENKAHGQHFIFAAVEKEPPHLLGLYRLSDEAIKLSNAENTSLLKKYAQCLETDYWPGYTEGIEDISIPEYGVTTLEENHGTEESI